LMERHRVAIFGKKDYTWCMKRNSKNPKISCEGNARRKLTRAKRASSPKNHGH